MLAYAAVVLVGLLVFVQTLSPDVSSLHRVPRTLAGQAEFTVVPPAPTPDVSGVDAIPGAGAGNGDGADKKTDQDRAGEAEQPGQSGQKPGGGASTEPPAGAPEDSPSVDPTLPSDPGGGGGEDETTPPTLIPSVGPIPGIMAPLIWPFVSADDSKPLDEAVPMFVQDLIEAESGAKVEDLPDSKDETISAGEAPKTPRAPQRRSGLRNLAPERVPEEKTCEPAADEVPETQPSASESDETSTKSEPKPEDEATPECAEACAEPTSPVGSSPAADGKESTDPDSPSDEETTGAPVTEESSQGSGEGETCAEESAH